MVLLSLIVTLSLFALFIGINPHASPVGGIYSLRIALFFVVILIIWIIFFRRRSSHSFGAAISYWFGIVIVMLPIIFYGNGNTLEEMSAKTYHRKTMALVRSATLKNYHEDLILQPGFDKPFGIRMEFELQYKPPPALVYTYFRGPTIISKSQHLGRDSNPIQLKPKGTIYSSEGTILLSKDGQQKLSFDFFPSGAKIMDDGRKVCWEDGKFPYNNSQDPREEILTVTQIMTEGYGDIDYTQQLTKFVHENSRLLTNEGNLWSYYAALLPNSLLNAGYISCDDMNLKGWSCFCRDPK